MVVCFWGSYDPAYPRNYVIRNGLRSLGIDVLECNVAFGEGGRIWQRYRALVQQSSRKIREADVLFVPEFNHKNVPLAWVLAKRASIPLVFDPLVSMYDTNVIDRGRVSGVWERLANRLWDRVSFCLPDLVLADTKAHSKHFIDDCDLLPSKSRVIYLGVPDDIFYPRPLPSRKGILVTFFGRYIPLQGIEVIIQTADILRQDTQVHFELIGTGQTYEVIRALANSLELRNVFFIRDMPLSKLAQRASRADICLGIFGTTPKAFRVIPNKVVQSMALRRPVITADTPAIREVFQPGEHLVTCDAGDPRALAQMIRVLVDNTSLRYRIADSGSRWIQDRFTMAHIGRGLASVFEALVWQRL